VAAAWPTNAWNGDSGAQAVAAIGAGNPLTFLSIVGGPLNDGVIPVDAVVTNLTVAFNWQIFLTAGNALIITEGHESGSTNVTVTGDGSGSLSGSYTDDLPIPPGTTWQNVIDAHFGNMGWSLQRSAAAQAGGTARILITAFQIIVTYSGGTPTSITFIKVPPVPGRVPARQGKA
jgi:hypothetical protein